MYIHIDIGLPLIIHSRHVYGIIDWMIPRMDSLIRINGIPRIG